MEALLAFARRQRYSRILFFSWDYPQGFDLSAVSLTAHKRKEYIIDLREAAGAIHQKVRPYIKRNAKRAKNMGLTCHQSHSELMVRNLLGLLDDTKQRRIAQGHLDYDYYYMPFLDDEVVYQLIRRRKARIFYVRNAQEILSTVLLVTHEKRAYTLLNATSTEGYQIGANHLLQLELLKKMKSEGMDILNLGGVPGGAADPGLTFYKLSLGAEAQWCMGGATKMLKGFLLSFNPLLKVYDNLDREHLKQVLGPQISERIKLWKKGWLA